MFFICFDINNKESFQNVTMKWIPEIEYHSPDVPKIIVGCKMGKSFSPLHRTKYDISPEIYMGNTPGAISGAGTTFLSWVT